MTIIGLLADATYHLAVPAGSGQGWNPRSGMTDPFQERAKRYPAVNKRFTVCRSLAKVMAITLFPPVSWMDRYLSTSIPVSIWS